MAAARYWRLVGIETYSGGDLELSAVALYAGGARVDGTATLTCSHAPTVGALANLQDTDGGTTARFAAAAVRSGGFYLQWDFGTAVDIGEVKLGGAGLARFMAGATLLRESALGDWAYVVAFAGATYPGDGALTASSAGGLMPTTWNPLDKGAGCTLSDANLRAASRVYDSVRSVFGASSGKWYWEAKFTSGPYGIVGVGSGAAPINSSPAYPGSNASSWGIFKYDGHKYHSAVDAAYASAFAGNETVGVALDMDAGTIAFYQGGTTPGVAYSGLTGTIYAMFGGSWTGGADEVLANFGASAFVYAPPAGFQAGFGPTSLQLPATTPPAPHTAGYPISVAAASAVPEFSTRNLGRIATARDIEFGGPGTIYGTTKTKGTPNQPTHARVVLLHQRSKLPVRETWSDPVTGAFAFTGIDINQQFLTLAEDAAGNFRPVAASRLTPEVAP